MIELSAARDFVEANRCSVGILRARSHKFASMKVGKVRQNRNRQVRPALESGLLLPNAKCEAL